MGGAAVRQALVEHPSGAHALHDEALDTLPAQAMGLLPEPLCIEQVPVAGGAAFMGVAAVEQMLEGFPVALVAPLPTGDQCALLRQGLDVETHPVHHW